MRDSHFKAALAEQDSAIVQRRSGKPRQAPAVAAGPVLPLALFPVEEGEPGAVLESGKIMARAFAASLPDAKRLELARAFCTALVSSYWARIQSKYRTVWPLPEALLNDEALALEEPCRSLAESLGRAASGLEAVEAAYSIGVVYTAMLPEETRSRLGVYYTPPGLTGRLLDMASAAGVDWRQCRVLDPACGGGAFLAPVALRMAAAMGTASAGEVVKSIAGRVRGFEIDPFSAWLAQVFLEAALMDRCRKWGKRLPVLVEVCNSLLRPPGRAEFDLVIGNPPFGRVTLDAATRERYSRSLYGHANLYGLFTDLAVQLTRPGGVIAYVTPTSFLAGEYFKALRSVLGNQAPPANLDFISVRKGVFEDALQETLLATYRRREITRGGRTAEATVHFVSPVDVVRVTAEPAGSFVLPAPPADPWLVPRESSQERLIARLRRFQHRLRDYGYEVSTGPLVWNRYKGQLRAKAVAGALPLIWAESVTAQGEFVFRAAKKNHEPYFLPAKGDEWLVSRRPCVLLQRTTAKEQSRRLIAAELPAPFLAKHGAVVIENHLNMIRASAGTPAVSSAVLARFLNSEIVDRAFRCLSGSVAVSAYELESLPLPPPEALGALAAGMAEGAGVTEIEEICRQMFEESK